MYELTDRVHPGAGDTFKKLCAGNGMTKGTPLKTVNWAGYSASHPYVRDIECWLAGTTPWLRVIDGSFSAPALALGLVTQCVPLC